MMNAHLIKAYIELTKPSINALVLVTTVLGFYLARRTFQPFDVLAWTMLGSALTCAGAAVLNQYLERDADAIMKRTMRRPIPSGKISAGDALIFGIVLILTGLCVLWAKVNLLTAFLSLLTCFLYVLVYTPMKRMTWLNTTIGSIPGAIPPMGGWAAATNDIGFGAWILFFIMFAWQHPHFYAIAWILKEDYKKAGFRMLPVVYPNAAFTNAQIIAFTFALIAFSLMPTMIGMSGQLYFWGALILGIGFLAADALFLRKQSNTHARYVLLASVVYLPLLLGLIIADVLL